MGCACVYIYFKMYHWLHFVPFYLKISAKHTHSWERKGGGGGQCMNIPSIIEYQYNNNNIMNRTIVLV